MGEMAGRTILYLCQSQKVEIEATVKVEAMMIAVEQDVRLCPNKYLIIKNGEYYERQIVLVEEKE